MTVNIKPSHSTSRRRQLEHVFERCERVIESSESVIFGGDLNLLEDDVGWKLDSVGIPPGLGTLSNILSQKERGHNVGVKMNAGQGPPLF